jgi:hypothetical protein
MSVISVLGTAPKQSEFTSPIDPATVAETHARLKPEGVEAYIRFMLNRTPADMQDEMYVLLQEDLAGAGGGPADPTQAVIMDGQSVMMLDSAGALYAGSPGLANVMDGQLTHIQASVAVPPGIVLGADQAIVTAFDQVPTELNTVPAPWTGQFIVTNNVCDKIKFMPNASAVALVAGTNVPVKSAALVPVAGSPGVADITFSALNGVNLTV